MRRTLSLLLVALAVLVALLFVVTWMPLRQARDAWRGGRDADAIAAAERWSRLHLWPSQYHQLLAAAYLSSDNAAGARPHLDALAGRTLWINVLPEDEVARRLFARGGYADFVSYDAASRPLRVPPDVPLYRAAAQASLNRITEADAAFKAIDRGDVDPAKYAALQQAIEQRKQGSYPLVFDRDGHTIAAYQIANSDLVAVDSQFAPLVDREAGALTIESQLPRLGTSATIETTLDPEVQKAALAALGGFRGSLVAIDPRTNEILAIASNHGNGPEANLALEKQYEPGSVVKILTGLNALQSGVSVPFPYECKGELMIDGRHFGDWLPQGHGVLPSLEEAFAQSCNVVFADLGIRLGRDRLHGFMARAGFDGQADLGIAQVPLGKTIGPIFNNFETAFYAIGLSHESTTALHLAMVASMVANRGVMTTPRLLRARRSILGESVAGASVQSSTQLAGRPAAEGIIRGMVAVVTSPKGTGRRAAVEGLTLAMKTGTAGSREGGLEAMIVAFAPVEQPRIAFGMIAEDSGPAEFAGAKIAHDFLRALKPRL